MTLRHNGQEQCYACGDSISFSQLLGKPSSLPVADVAEIQCLPASEKALGKDTPFWDRMHDIESVFHLSLEQNDLIRMTNQLLEADRLLWQAQLDLENPEFVSQGRELYREMIVLAGTGIEQAAQVIPRKFKSLVSELVKVREHYRSEKRWSEADQIRTILQKSEVVLEDTEEGPVWRL